MFPMEQLTQEWTLPKNFRIDPSWFDHPSTLHGKMHTLRVMILADELYLRAKQESLFSSPTLYRDLMAAALIHDLARKHDGFCMEHGLWAKNTKRPIAERYLLGFRLPEPEWTAIADAIEAHSRPDPTPPFPPGSLPALLKDADGLDRVRIYMKPPNPAYFRHPFTAEYLDLAWELLKLDEERLEGIIINKSKS